MTVDLAIVCIYNFIQISKIIILLCLQKPTVKQQYNRRNYNQQRELFLEDNIYVCRNVVLQKKDLHATSY